MSGSGPRRRLSGCGDACPGGCRRDLQRCRGPCQRKRMGRAWPRYTPADELYAKYLKGEPEASEARRQQLRAKADREGNRTARAGWEMVFSPVKSFSVLWAMADDEQRARLEAVERAAFEKVFALIERRRAGRGWGRPRQHRFRCPAGGSSARFSPIAVHVPAIRISIGIWGSARRSAPRTGAGWRWMHGRCRPPGGVLRDVHRGAERGMAAVSGFCGGLGRTRCAPPAGRCGSSSGWSEEVVSGLLEAPRRPRLHWPPDRDFRVREGREPSRVEEYKLAQVAALASVRTRSRPPSRRSANRWIEQARRDGYRAP